MVGLGTKGTTQKQTNSLMENRIKPEQQHVDLYASFRHVSNFPDLVSGELFD